MSAVVRSLHTHTVGALVARMTAADRYALAKQLVAEMPEADRQRLMANSPGFVSFARAFLVAAGRPRPTG